MEESREGPLAPNINDEDLRKPLSIVILGASGDLAQRKLLPALFALHSQGLLPPRVHFVGFSRTPLADADFRARAAEHLTCRYVPEVKCADHMQDFLSRCRYVAGQYGSPDAMRELAARLRELEDGEPANRLYYFAIPPSIFAETARAIGAAGLVGCAPGACWSRIVIEKPFGRDRASSDEMQKELAEVFPEQDIYRIDHYLGKELVQNLMVLRFANSVFEPFWSHAHVSNVQITWKETAGIGNRGGYFDAFGIIRDVMQNHLLQIVALLAMEEPSSLDFHEIRNEKVRVLRSIPPLELGDLVLGQYRGRDTGTTRLPSYTEEPGVPPGSLAATYAAAVLHVNNPRWERVPFLLRAGKALNAHVNEIHLHFRPRFKNLFERTLPKLPGNELIIRIQPDEAIFLRVVNKVPGLKLALEQTTLNLRYGAAFDETIPEAYETLLLDAIRGDRSLFIRNDELQAAWDIFTPALHEIEARRLRPEPYDFGSEGPEAAEQLARRHGTTWQ